MKRMRLRLNEAMRNDRYRKKLTPVPYLFTFANAFLGFIAIVYALDSNYTYAVYSIMLAALMDMCDGRLARALGTSSELGRELDSLADGISFGVAPCVVLYTWYPGVIGYTGFFALASYLSAGLYRLARFNLTAAQQSNYSIGLPIPVAAFFVSNLVLYHEWILEHRTWFVLYKRIPFIIVCIIAFCMVSTIPFPTFKHYRVTLDWRHKLGLIALWVLLLFLFIKGYPLLLMGIGAYIIGSIVRWMVWGSG